MQRLFSAIAVLSIVFVAFGCGGGAEGDSGRVDTFETTGTINYKGKPLADALVSFSPKGSQPVAVGRTDSSGHYSLRTYEDGDGAAAGDYIVLITKTVTSNSGPAPHDPNSRTGTPPAAHSGPKAAETKSEIPMKYSSPNTSGLEATVKDGENTFNFDLKD